jgi:hypothetical protein
MIEDVLVQAPTKVQPVPQEHIGNLLSMPLLRRIPPHDVLCLGNDIGHLLPRQREMSLKTIDSASH